ncbi:UDP-3-O-(3-hydroxymyristoyl)glucosamine N-acyltransferase [Marivita sp. XM-24bin2]|jgi:UDP-3-O-[3-hydroxymyristoyl] glucosamine N-acyltransferase|uniref:UDP-3-O-(3-hydroxymyristoyl)glucosamine N-acyltransferase n=1 Tax=unclassified Marivita TaxID=2632480 RepID=UPI000D7B64E1|nr:UDP-3-O-(3-hydroxymyristoyl)glucosamine N-acyltransferase [Marivita sp. XM-24bin2]MCR9109798.1 UDP-3-O-(3-hydroxymyristoyl)glucosamine N-acyltransferase [Paracoccaceae bacterium]PWL35217.1 MAG: UDP-3-O-(3-hydroxymyristoyl)glucosamine N-acyltransferase [Marivita sp. XM-24bin2]
MSFTIAQIADALGIRAEGDTALTVTAVAEPRQAQASDLALAMKPDFAEQLSEGKARAAMLWDGADWQAMGLKAALMSPRPRYAMSGLSAMMDAGAGYAAGIHPTAVIDPTARLAEDVSVGAFAVIGAGAEIKAGSVIGAQVFIGQGTVIGADALLHPGVKIGHGVTIGDRFIAHFGATVGADGFSFVTPEPSAAEKVRETLGDQAGASAQSYARIHSLGGVVIGNDVELGANSCIDRGTVRATRIGNGCKFDNLAQVGHNVVIGNDCLICAQVGIAGSSRIGNNVVLGGQTGVSDNIFIGDNVVTGGATKVLSNVPSGRVMLGYPAMKMDSQLEIYRQLRRLPRLIADVARLKKSVSKTDASD